MDLTVFDNFSLVQIIGWDQRERWLHQDQSLSISLSVIWKKKPNTNNQKNAEWVQFNRLNNSITIKIICSYSAGDKHRAADGCLLSVTIIISDDVQ